MDLKFGKERLIMSGLGRLVLCWSKLSGNVAHFGLVLCIVFLINTCLPSGCFSG